MEVFDFKKEFNENGLKKLFYDWEKGFKFEIVYGKNKGARIYINHRKTKYYIRKGYKVNKESTILCDFINDLIGTQKYESQIYDNKNILLMPGIGFESIKKSFESIEGNKLVKLYNGLNSDIYEITFNQGNK